MGKRLYVGNLAFTVTEEELRVLFGAAGTVESATIGLGGSASSARGFGYVEMSTDDEAFKAVSLFNGHELQGRRLNVKEPQEQQSGGIRFRRGGPRKPTT